MPHYFEHINILILPTDACNMNCVYCFHKPYSKDVERMSLNTVKRILEITTPYYKKINLIWHGGEPLIMGLDFYKDVIHLQKKYKSKINNSIQSNLTLMTDEFADFIIHNKISISSSFDGICNDELRGNSDKILTGRRLILDKGGKCGFIMVVSSKNINYLIESYSFFKNLSTGFSLNLYVSFKDDINKELKLDKSITIHKLCELFDYWATDTANPVSISYFNEILNYILLRKKSLCSYTSCLGRWIGIRHDGTITPCNRYFPSEFNFGNVYEYQDIGDAFNSNGFINMLNVSIERRNKCKTCDIFDFCSGGCNNVALNENGISNNKGMTCDILLAVYKYIESYVKNLTDTDIENAKYNPLLIKLLRKRKN